MAAVGRLMRRGCCLGAPGAPEDVRVGRQERCGAELEALARLDLESGVLDGALGVSGHVAAARDVRPERGVGETLESCLAGRVGDDMLVEAQLAAGEKGSSWLS